uniref:ER membrane protein complex subunit 9 n=2 Tax=Iconisemion striatum TaxID=60296 RepID=A0A1A7YUN3_9TELE
MGEVELSCRAYVKMYLHACLFPRSSINGLLLSSSSSTGGATCVTDCVPLLHSHLSLAPITQLALTQVDVWCSQTQQRIVGYYQANACTSDSSPTPCALKIADKIAEQFDGAVLLMLDGSKMSPDYRVPPIVMYERKDSRWTLKDKHTIMLRQWEEIRAITSQMLESGDHSLLVDFDSHLDDITKDWTNQKLNNKIAELCSPVNGNI